MSTKYSTQRILRSHNILPCAYDEYRYNMGDAAEKTWDDVKDSRSGELARLAYGGMLLLVVLTALGTVAGFVSKYFFGTSGALLYLMIGAMVLMSMVGLVLNKTWTAFRLRKESFQ